MLKQRGYYPPIRKEDDIMYKNVIKIRKDVPEEVLKSLSMIAEHAFDNRVGRVQNVSDDPYKLVFQGGEEAYECLNLGMLNLWDNKNFVACVQSWDWIDEYEPDENCDVIKELSIPVIM